MDELVSDLQLLIRQPSVSAKNEGIEDPTVNDIHKVGTVAVDELAFGENVPPPELVHVPVPTLGTAAKLYDNEHSVASGPASATGLPTNGPPEKVIGQPLLSMISILLF